MTHTFSATAGRERAGGGLRRADRMTISSVTRRLAVILSKKKTTTNFMIMYILYFVMHTGGFRVILCNIFASLCFVLFWTVI